METGVGGEGAADGSGGAGAASSGGSTATGGTAAGGATGGSGANPTGGVGGDPTTGGVGGNPTGGVGAGVTGGTGGGTGGTDCTNVRPTGTDWDEASCDDWATQTDECSAAWMIDNHYCDESCGRCGSGGTGGTGGSGATGGGGTSGSGSTGAVDCNAAMPTSGGQDHSATWAEGGAGNLAWQIWSNGGPGTITTYDGVAAFRASWNNSGDFLGRMGFEWGNSGQQYTAHGTIKADYVWSKSGNAGQYSYLGIYGWSNNPCVEWYIVEDSFHAMPFNTGEAPVGTAEIDGGTYNLVYRHTSGTGGDRCGGAGSWDQYYSIRLEGRDCGTITVSDHFDVWAAQGWNLGNLLEVKIVVEAAGGQGSVDFPVANVTTSQ